MPTHKPRINLTVPQHLNETFARLAELQGRSRGAVIVELLIAIEPSMRRTIATLEAAQDAPKELRENLRKTVEDMEKELTAALGVGVQQMDMLLEQLQRQNRGNRPPPSNTGVTSNDFPKNQQHRKS